MILNIILAVLILVNTFTVAIETIQQLYVPFKQGWFIFDSIVTAIFTLELVLRLFAKATSFKLFFGFIISFFFIVDMASILPFYLELLIEGSETMDYGRWTGLRLVRVFKLLQMFRFLPQVRYIQFSFEVAGESITRSLGALFPM
jgi:hypothetical protein